MIILLTLMWIFSLDTSQCVSFRYTSISCLENYKLNRTNQDKLTCTGEHIVNHCIPDDQQKEMEVCVRMKWIISGYCPYYDTFSDAIKERHCSLYCLRKDNSQDICICPSSFNDALCTKKCGENFLSDKYVSCEHGGVSTEISPTSGGHDTSKSTESPVDFSTTLDAAFGINGTNTPPESQFDGSVIGIALGVIVPLILLVVVGILLFKKRRHIHDTSKGEPAMEMVESETLLNTGTNCQEENEQNDRRQTDERTSTEAVESSPLLAGNTNQNQSQEDAVKNGDTSEVNKLDSSQSQKNDSFLTPPTSPTTAQDILTNDVVGAEKKKEVVLESKRTSSSPGEVLASGTEDNLQLSSVDDTEKQNMVGSNEGNQSDREGNGDKDQTLHDSSGPNISTDQSNKGDSHDENENSSSGVEYEHSPQIADNTLSESNKGGGSPVNVSEEHEHQNKTIDTNMNNSAGSDSDQDGNEEDTSKATEKKEAVGIFVNSLESIQKEDDEEGGTKELYDLLDHMCTGPARKILFIVIKEYVDNIDSYFQDESKKASARMLLPPEYHSALNTESESRNSIPVMYAILQSSLHAEHQPKSGWGQEVKDTDTGVGDDVERVYRVYTLSREIRNPEEISVDGYVSLFEMFIGAIERLDIKGKCSEDYREIVRRWERIQRKLWVKDEWNTFTNFIKKWSE